MLAGDLPTEQDEDARTGGLIDDFGRRVDYLRISVTDRCDLRCVYCMAEDVEFLPRDQVLTLEEIGLIAKAFVDLGVKKIRVTGGEPLTRRNVMTLFEGLGRLRGLDELTLTTNGTLLSQYAEPLKRAGVHRVNISIDTLREERFRSITRVGDLNRTLAGIEAARTTEFNRVKLNSVIMKGRNDDEIVALAEFAFTRGMDICFIEEMPLGIIADHDRAEVYCSSDEVLEVLDKHYELVPTTERTGGPSRYYRVAGIENRVGFISPHSHNFCSTCNRVRLTAEGRLLLCLGQEHSVDLRQVIRTCPPDDDSALRRAIVDSMALKPQGHEFDLHAAPVLFRHMNATGG